MPLTLTRIDQVFGHITFHFSLARGKTQDDGEFSGGLVFKLFFFFFPLQMGVILHNVVPAQR